VSQSLLNEVWFPTPTKGNGVSVDISGSQSLLNEVWFPTISGVGRVRVTGAGVAIPSK